MLRERAINVLEAALVLLTLANALSIAAAAYAISLARGGIPLKPARRNQALVGHSFSGTACGRKPKAMELGHERHIRFVCLNRPSCSTSAVLGINPNRGRWLTQMAVRPVLA